MDSAKGAKESLNIINRALPNIQSYLCNVLKKENLSLEAEALRARYEAMLMHLEKSSKQADIFQNGGGLAPSQRHSAIAAFDRPVLTRGGTLPSPSRRRTDGDISSFRHASSMEGIHTIPEVPKTTAELEGFLLMEDDHERWHKRYCRIISQKRILTVHESASEDDEAILVIQLVGASMVFDLPECDKDLNFGVKAMRASSEVSILSPVNELKLHIFAAYSEVDLTKWCSAIESTISSPADIFDVNVGQSTMLPHPNRDSVFSGGRTEEEVLGPIQGRPPEPLPLHESDEGNQSDCTIYEDIDELVQQLDKTIQATAQAMSEMSPKKPKKKRRRTLFEKNQNSSNKVLSEHKTKLEEGDRFTGYLYKRSGASWKKKWCQLKGCIFSYSKSPSDATSHEHILLRAEISIVKDAKKPHAFKLACKGVKEAFFAADDEAELTEWIARLQNASKRRDDLSALVDDSGVEEGGEALPEGIYNVPRSMLSEDMIDPITNVPIAGGIYDVPRSLLAENSHQVVMSQQGVEFHMSGKPFDIYDVPRSSMDHEDDTIYDNPLDFDLDDIEIYDYPPDASQLDEILHPSRDSNSSNEYPMGDNDSSSHSHTPGSADGTISSTSSYRQSGSIGSIEDVSSATAASYFGDGYRSLPHNKPPQVESFISSIGSVDSSNNKSSSDLNSSQSSSVSSSMDFGQTTKTGNLLRKERLKWSQCFCLIRNSFLECHKSNATNMGKPLLKLLLLGSEVTPVQDSKKPWAFQIKHPRRDGILIFAAENSTDYKSWVEAFKNASSIKVQQVSTMEDIRISDSDLKKKWRSAEKNLGDETPQNESNKEVDDSPKRDKRKLFGRQSQRKSSRKAKNPSELFSYTCDTDSNGGGQASMKRSLSMELITRPTESTPFGPKIASQAHRAISPEGLPCFQGYLKLKSSRDDKWSRMWCMFEDMMIKCYTSQRNLTGVKQIPLRGCTIARADNEAKKKFTFRIWNSDTLESVYFSAAEEDEYHSWMTEITKGAIKQTSAGNPSPNETMAVVYYYPKDYQPQPSPSNSTANASPNIQSRLLPEQPKPVIDMPGVTHHGPLRKRSDKGNWNVRYCRLRDSCLYVYYTGSDQTPITVLAVKHCKIEPVKLSPADSNELHTFIVAVKGGKTHTFAAADQQDLQNWLKVLQECVTTMSSPRPRSDSKSGVPRSQSPLLSSHSKADVPSPATSFRGRTSSLVSHVPASSLTRSSNAGYCEISHGKGAWSRNWCVLHENLLYVYQHKESKSSIKTVVLQGYKVEHFPSTDKQFAISLTHSSNSGLLLATNNQVDMMNWFRALDLAAMGGGETRGDNPIADIKPKTNEAKPDKDNSTTTPSSTAVHSEASQHSEMPSEGLVTNALSLEEHMKQMDGEGEAMPSLGEGPLNIAEYKEKCKLVTSHFEKRIKKTRKVAQQTEENLKKQREQLTTLKDKFLEHTERLKMAPNESETSQKKRKDMEVKISQIAKILPYLEKYMQANRQAELQTLAILKEGCTVKLQELEARYQKQLDSKLGSPSIGKLDRRMSMPANIGASRVNKEKKSRNNSERSGLTETTKSDQPIAPLVADSNVPSVSTNYTSDSASTSTSSITATPITSTTTIAMPTSEPVIEEPAYAVVGHLKHKHSREPSLPEHYVKLQLNQDTNDTVDTSQQEIGVHYSTVHVKPKHSSSIHAPPTPATPPSLPVATPPLLPVDEPGSNMSQDRGGVELENEKERVELELERESHSSPLPFISSAESEDNDGDLLNVTSSETSLGLLDTVVEEESTSFSPVVMVTDTPISASPAPCTPTNENRGLSPISLTGGLPPSPVCDNDEDQQLIPSQPSSQLNLSTLAQSSSSSNPSLLENLPSKPATPLATPTPPLATPPPPPVPPTSTTSNDITAPQTIVSSLLMYSSITDDVRTSSPTKRPPPPPVMKKTRSRSPNKQPSPTIPNKVMATPPSHSVIPQQQTNILPVGPPPVKTKPIRKPRSSSGPPSHTGLIDNQKLTILSPITNDDSGNMSNPDALPKSLTSVAQRMKAFQ